MKRMSRKDLLGRIDLLELELALEKESRGTIRIESAWFPTDVTCTNSSLAVSGPGTLYIGTPSWKDPKGLWRWFKAIFHMWKRNQGKPCTLSFGNDNHFETVQDTKGSHWSPDA